MGKWESNHVRLLIMLYVRIARIPISGSEYVLGIWGNEKTRGKGQSLNKYFGCDDQCLLVMIWELQDKTSYGELILNEKGREMQACLWGGS